MLPPRGRSCSAVVIIGLGVAIARRHARPRRRRRGRPRRALRRARASAGSICCGGEAQLVARKLPGLRRELDARALFSVAYGEIASSIYFALGVLAPHALGFTPLVLLAAGAALPRRLALVRRRHRGDPGDGRRRDVRPPRLQRPRRLPHRLGALPRLPDRDRALGALHAALPRGRAPGRRARPQPVGRRLRRRA